MLWLDFLLFGNGYGMQSPYHDDKFYWLVDTNQKDRKGKNGRLYRFCGGLGAQLQSYEWFAPPAGTRRTLCGVEYKINYTIRYCLLRVECSWEAVDAPPGLDAKHAYIRMLKSELDQL